ncbi:MAG: VWA domain-containing protein [Candidatus Rokubacteria bacterium]|nr:VWA domain-containing protein [Candidatus Rokubacteria bacterium]
MDQRILEFIGDLRRAELRISPSEALDALAASAEVGLEDRDTFRTALATTLVKESRDLPTFDRLFDLYFLDLEALGTGLKKALGPEDPRMRELLDRLAAEDGLQMDEMTELMLRGEGADMEMAIRQGGEGTGLERLMYFLQIGYFSRRIYDKFDWDAIERDLSRIMRLLEARGLDPGQLARIRNYLDLRLEAFRRMIRQHVERELERRAYRQGEKLTREVLSDKPLFALSPDEVAQMKAVVARLARRIKDALALRQRQEEKGRLDSRRTIRQSLQYGGVPMEVRFRRRHREKPKLVTLCDVSDSVRNASRFMLQLVWSLQECFSRVRSYAFVSEIAEVTQAFNTYTVDKAIEWALKSSSVDYHCRSDFGYAFSRFCRTELESLDRKTTVLVLGDARNNYNDPQAWAVRQIRERVKGIIWLNPEGQWGWGIGDSVMPLYAPSCDIVKECRTVGQLVQVVDQLVHSWWRRGR